MKTLFHAGVYVLFLFALIALVLFISQPEAMAYNNQIDISLSGVGGERTEPLEKFDSSFSTFGLSYTRYFKSLESGASPHALREFLQHPSRAHACLVAEGYRLEAQTRVYSDETGLGSFVLGGMYYLDKANSTGFGLSLRSQSGKREEKDSNTLLTKENFSGGGLDLMIYQYIGGNVRLELELSSKSFRSEDDAGVIIGEYKQGMTSLGASAVLGNVWLSGHLAGGNRDWKYSLREQDVGHIDLSFGYYFNRQWGLLVGMTGDSFEEGVLEESTGTFSIGGDYYFNDKMHLTVSLESRKVTETRPGLEVETKMSGIGLALGVLFQ